MINRFSFIRRIGIPECEVRFDKLKVGEIIEIHPQGFQLHLYNSQNKILAESEACGPIEANPHAVQTYIRRYSFEFIRKIEPLLEQGKL